MRLSGCVALVTGAASGIGAALARRLRAAGAATVVLVDRDGDAASALAHEIGGVARCVDVTDETAVADLVADVVDRWGRLDLVCSNAGATTEAGLDAPIAVWRDAYEVNVLAHVHLARAALPGMRARRRGRLLVTASAAGLLTAPGDAPYTVTKHAAVGLAEWIELTHGGDGVGVSVLCPMAVATPMLAAAPAVTRAASATGDVVSAEHVAEVAIEGIAADRFLLLPHPQVAGFWAAKATDPQRWLCRLRRRLAQDVP